MCIAWGLENGSWHLIGPRSLLSHQNPDSSAVQRRPGTSVVLSQSQAGLFRPPLRTICHRQQGCVMCGCGPPSGPTPRAWGLEHGSWHVIGPRSLLSHQNPASSAVGRRPGTSAPQQVVLSQSRAGLFRPPLRTTCRRQQGFAASAAADLKTPSPAKTRLVASPAATEGRARLQRGWKNLLWQGVDVLSVIRRIARDL